MTKHDQRFTALLAGESLQPQSQFNEHFKWLGRLQRAVQDGLPSRDHVVKLRALFEAMHLMDDVLANQKTRSADDMFVLCALRAELPIVFYAFCRRLSVDACLTDEECDPKEVEEKLNSPAQSEVWQRLEAAAMCVSRSPESLVTADKVALHLDIKRTSLVTKAWPQPAVEGRGNRPAEFRWCQLRPVLEKQYPKEDWSTF